MFGKSKYEMASGSAATPPAVIVNIDRLREQGTMPFGNVAGVQVRVHVVFIAMTLLLGIDAGMRGEWSHALIIPAILATIALHELGHALASLRLGHVPHSVILHPLLMQPPTTRLPKHPTQEMWIALAGPGANFVTAAVASLTIVLAGRQMNGLPHLLDLFSGGLPARFVAFNLLVASVNLLPAFPLDGGQALRAMLVPSCGEMRATQIVATVGRMGAVIHLVVFSAYALGIIKMRKPSYLVSQNEQNTPSHRH